MTLALAKRTWNNRSPGIMLRGLISEEENDARIADVDFYNEDDFGGKYIAISTGKDKKYQWDYYPDESPIEKDDETE